MQKRWTIAEADHVKTDRLFQELKIFKVICQILVQRGVTSFEKAKDFFRPQLNQLHSPWLMKDMRLAVDRIISAIEKKEKILVFGDYDVDGTTSVASMYQFIQTITLPELVQFYIPHRYREGYGVSKMGIDYADENEFSLIISLDCGIKSTDLIQYAKDLSIDFIVCDHHLPDDQLPPAVAILNPKQNDCNYPYKELCGCGVGYKLISALTEQLNLPEEKATTYLDLVATAIAADIVPITGENRILAYYGLKKANENPCNGIKALKHLSGHQSELHITNLVFLIAPRVNAAGRMDDASKAVQMFIAPSYTEALAYAEMLHSDNDDRKEADASITEEALAMIQASDELISKKTTVIYQPHWHKGVVGIVASRLTEHFYRPTIVLTKSGEFAAGSARSVNGFNLYEAIHACRNYLLGYGGHFAAAGLTLLPENIPAFTKAFEEVVTEQITDELLIPEIRIDAEISFADITPGFYKILQQMEPFGPENMRPVFITRNVTDAGYTKIVKEQHLRLVVKENNVVLTGIFFRAAHYYPIVQQGAFDIVYTIDENEWNGSVSLQLKVMDIRPSTV
jgi:single-stranded-DNA-specific exonuclease